VSGCWRFPRPAGGSTVGRGDLSAVNNPATIVMSENRAVIAVFVPAPFTLSNLSPDPVVEVAAGVSTRFTYVAKVIGAYFTRADWYADGELVGGDDLVVQGVQWDSVEGWIDLTADGHADSHEVKLRLTDSLGRTTEYIWQVKVVRPSTGDPSVGEFSAALNPGLNVTTYSGGTAADLAALAASVNVKSAAVAVGGRLLVLVSGAPAFVNEPFDVHFASGIPPGTAMLLVVG